MAYGYSPVTYDPLGSVGNGRPARLNAGARSRLFEEATRESSGGLLSSLFWGLDTLGAGVRGALAGDPLSVLGNEDERVSGRELLEQYGLLDENNKTTPGWWAGLAAEALLDPLTYATFGMSSLTKAGKVAKAAGLLDRAPEYLTKQFLAGKAAPEIAERASASLSKLGRNTISAAEAAGYPLVGKRAARRYGTLGDLIDYAPDTERALESAKLAAGGEDILAGLRGERLGKSFGLGVGIPFTNKSASVAGDFFGTGVGNALTDIGDAVGTGLRWNQASRLLRPLVDKSVAGSVDMPSQILQSGASIVRGDAMSAAAREAAEAQARLLSGGAESIDEIFSEEGNRAMGRIIEDPSVNRFASQDEDFMGRNPAVRQYVQWWKDKSEKILEQSSEAGIGAERFADPNISGYLPRTLGSPLEILGQRDMEVGRAISTLTPDQMHRSTAAMVPGGRDTLAFELSRDPFLVGNRAASKVDKAKYITEKIGVDSKQATELAELLDRLPAEIMQKSPLFGQHPTEMITSYMKRRAGAISDANTIVESLAAKASATPSMNTVGDPTISLTEALRRTGLSSTDAGGASQSLRGYLAKALDGNPNSVELSKYSVPESFVNHLLKAKEVIGNSEAAGVLSRGLNHYMVMLKSGLLTWPSRYIRDLLSGGISNYLEGALSRRGVQAAWSLLHAPATDPSFQKALAKMPLYSGLPDAERAVKFYGDLAATGLVDAAKHVDIDTSGLHSVSAMVGVQPDSVRGAIAQLGKGADESWGKYLKEMNPLDPTTYNSQFRPNSPTTNRVAQMGMRLSEISDRLNRLSGYMELLMQGVDPMEAARRIKRVQVDYSSLTPAEKKIRDTIFPFYAYTSRMFQEVMRQIMEKPGGRYAQIMRAKVRNDEALADSAGDGYVPEYLRDQWAIPVGANSAGEQTYLSNIDVPGLDPLGVFDTDAPIQGTAKNLALMANPAIRVAAENAFGRDLFRNAPLENTRPSDTAGWVDGLTGLLPYAARPYQLYRQVNRDYGSADAAESLGRSAISNTVGVKFTSPSAGQSEYDAYRILSEGVAPYSEEDKILRLLLEERRKSGGRR